MDYERVYANLIAKARREYSHEYTEKHHIIPRSCGGTDDVYNLVLLTIKQHYLAHLLLYKIGYRNQIFSVECFLKDSLNPHHRRYKKIRYKRWVRKAIHLERLRVQREWRMDK